MTLAERATLFGPGPRRARGQRGAGRDGDCSTLRRELPGLLAREGARTGA
ncbi:hypothetical protein [Deinococcus hopiensis]|nr:hypothetical protein [Deinococcus hopiensis]